MCLAGKEQYPGNHTLRRLFSRPPWHGSSSAPNVCGGAQRGISLATGFFTGESRRNPLGEKTCLKSSNISIL